MQNLLPWANFLFLRVQETKTVEASMRLDAVASAGFRMSRSKMVDLIKSGDVRSDTRAKTYAAPFGTL